MQIFQKSSFFIHLICFVTLFCWDCNNGCASGYVDQCCQGRSVCFGWFDSSHQGSFRQENQRPFDEPSKRICEGKMLAAFALLILFNISLCFLCTHSALVNRKLPWFYFLNCKLSFGMFLFYEWWVSSPYYWKLSKVRDPRNSGEKSVFLLCM